MQPLLTFTAENTLPSMTETSCPPRLSVSCSQFAWTDHRTACLEWGRMETLKKRSRNWKQPNFLNLQRRLEFRLATPPPTSSSSEKKCHHGSARISPAGQGAKVQDVALAGFLSRVSAWPPKQAWYQANLLPSVACLNYRLPHHPIQPPPGNTKPLNFTIALVRSQTAFPAGSITDASADLALIIAWLIFSDIYYRWETHSNTQLLVTREKGQLMCLLLWVPCLTKETGWEKQCDWKNELILGRKSRSLSTAMVRNTSLSVL